MVVYNGVDAFVMKFIMPENMTLKEAIKHPYIMGCDGEKLKIDALYPITLDEIISLRDGSFEYNCIFERFKAMYFDN